MGNADVIELDWIVVSALGGAKYKVLLKDMDLEITAYSSGKMKKNKIRIIPGDLVKVELSPYDPTQGRITYRAINKDVERQPRLNKSHSSEEVSAE